MPVSCTAKPALDQLNRASLRDPSGLGRLGAKTGVSVKDNARIRDGRLRERQRRRASARDERGITRIARDARIEAAKRCAPEATIRG
jgi:hypothetical protein